MASQQRQPTCPPPDATRIAYPAEDSPTPRPGSCTGDGQSGHITGLATSTGRRRSTLPGRPECEAASQFTNGSRERRIAVVKPYRPPFRNRALAPSDMESRREFRDHCLCARMATSYSSRPLVPAYRCARATPPGPTTPDRTESIAWQRHRRAARQSVEHPGSDWSQRSRSAPRPGSRRRSASRVRWRRAGRAAGGRLPRHPTARAGPTSVDSVT
jgi:hypothetical protein